MSPQRRIVLVVLESADHRAHFNHALADTLHSIMYSFDGADGFDRFLEARPDICFVSENVTRISGTILCRLIREHRFGQGLGVFLMSGRVGEKDLEMRAKEVGADKVIDLPPPQESILELVEGPYAFKWDPVADEHPDTEDEAEPAEREPAGDPVAAEAGEVLTTTQAGERVTLYVRLPEDAEKQWPPPDDQAEAAPEAVGGELAEAASPPIAAAPPSGEHGAAPVESGAAQTVETKAAPFPARTENDLPATALGDTEKIPAIQHPTKTPAAVGFREQTDPDVTPRVDTREDLTPIEPVPKVPPRGGAVGAAASAKQEPVPEDPTPVAPVANILEEPTPISEPRPALTLEAASSRMGEESGSVFASGAFDGDTTRLPNPELQGKGPRDQAPRETSGIYPLAPEERDSDTLRRAISESQLGSRLTRRIMALYRLLDAVDYYQLLGVSNDVNAQQLQEVFHGLALEYHPDRFFSLAPGLIKERVEALYSRISEAYSVIVHPGRRKRYDALLEQEGSGSSPRFLLGESKEPGPEDGSEASTPVGRKYLRLAFAAIAREDLDAAHLNLTFALGHEPDNEVLRERLADIERRMQSNQAPRP